MGPLPESFAGEGVSGMGFEVFFKSYGGRLIFESEIGD